MGEHEIKIEASVYPWWTVWCADCGFSELKDNLEDAVKLGDKHQKKTRSN